MNKLSRRSFSQNLGRGALALGAVSSFGGFSLHSLADDAQDVTQDNTQDEISANIEKATLAQYAYFIVPLLDPSHDRYRQVAEKVMAITRQVPPLAGLKNAGMAALSATDKGPWSQLSRADREATIKQLTGTPFFNFLRWNATEIVMREPKLWRQLGYQGSSIEHGGYLNRGFDDIDWLPARKGKI